MIIGTFLLTALLSALLMVQAGPAAAATVLSNDSLTDGASSAVVTYRDGVITDDPPVSPAMERCIAGIAWAPTETIRTAADESDNWPLTWADDDLLYTAYGDGYGFQPYVSEKLSMGFAVVAGGPDDFVARNIHPTNADQLGDGKRGRKASGMLCVDGTLIMWVRNALADQTGEKSTLAWSTDHARSWTFSDWVLDELGYPCFVNFGKDYAGARDDYVYSLSPNTPHAYNETDEVVLMRVPKTQITNRSAHEFFSGYTEDGTPTWDASIGSRAPVFRMPGGCNRMDVTYNAPLARYMMTMRSRAQAGGLDQFSLYEAPEPWGPWRQFFYTQQWDVDPGESAHIPSKWISADGLTIHLVFAGDDSFRVRAGALRIVGTATKGSVPFKPSP